MPFLATMRRRSSGRTEPRNNGNTFLLAAAPPPLPALHAPPPQSCPRLHLQEAKGELYAPAGIPAEPGMDHVQPGLTTALKCGLMNDEIYGMSYEEGEGYFRPWRVSQEEAGGEAAQLAKRERACAAEVSPGWPTIGIRLHSSGKEENFPISEVANKDCSNFENIDMFYRRGDVCFEKLPNPFSFLACTEKPSIILCRLSGL